MLDKIIFLDIDGPMIPATTMLFDRNASWEQRLDDRCVKVLRLILNESGSKIVFNTTHNRTLYLKKSSTFSTPGLVQRFIDAGFRENIHLSVCTKYPDLSRYDAIRSWLDDYGSVEDTKWVAFDDVFIDDDRAYLTSYDLGIGIGEFNHAAYWLGFKKRIVL